MLTNQNKSEEALAVYERYFQAADPSGAPSTLGELHMRARITCGLLLVLTFGFWASLPAGAQGKSLSFAFKGGLVCVAHAGLFQSFTAYFRSSAMVSRAMG